MKKNPVIPFALIALIGIILVIVISFVGLNQQKAIEDEEKGGEKQDQKAEGGTTDDPAAIFQNNCISCHGADLTGGVGPDLTEVGSRYSKDEIKEIIINGKGEMMPAGLIPDKKKVEALAKWLSKKK